MAPAVRRALNATGMAHVPSFLKRQLSGNHKVTTSGTALIAFTAALHSFFKTRPRRTRHDTNDTKSLASDIATMQAAVMYERPCWSREK